MDPAPIPARLRLTRAATATTVGAALGLLASCSSGAAETPPTTAVTSSSATPDAGPDAAAGPSPSPEVVWPAGPVLPAATSQPQDVATGLTSPWGLAFLPGGSALVTLRDPGRVVLLTGAGARTLTGPGADALAATTVHGGEGGLLGVAVSPTVAVDAQVYLYRTAADGNEVVRATLDPVAGTLGALRTVFAGIPAAGNHNGGRLAFGPDGFLYVSTGDAGDRPAAQDPASSAGKILRLTADGDPAPGNPTDGPVWSLGHRNVQGLAWDENGTMVAGEFGQDTFDELNVIVPGGNYGWPEVEGAADEPGFVDPVAAWNPDDASPSGVAVLGTTVYLAGLRGERLLTVPLSEDGAGRPGAALVGDLGRLRHVAVGPDGALWILTGNTDGRGDPRRGDDRVLRVAAP